MDGNYFVHILQQHVLYINKKACYVEVNLSFFVWIGVEKEKFLRLSLPNKSECH